MAENIPIGTQVAIRFAAVDIGNVNGPPIPADSVGVVMNTPTLDNPHVYALRFPDGRWTRLSSVFFVVRRFPLAVPTNPTDYDQYLVYKCVIGSRAYNLHDDDSDYDYRGVYLPPADLHWSLVGVPDTVERKEPDQVYWEYGRFCHLALKANPSILECLWTPMVEMITEPFARLREARSAFLSRLVYQTYNGYSISQFKKIEDDIRLHGKIKHKHAMHLIRLLLNGAELLRSGEVQLSMEKHHDDLRAIRAGAMPWPQIDAWRQKLHADFEVALSETKLPDKPDFDTVNRILIDARRSMV